MDDIDDMVQNDTKKAKKTIRQARSGDWKPAAGKLLEQVMFLVAILGVVFMVASLPFVGAEKLIPGRAWLGISLGIILIFGSVGFLVRIVRVNFTGVNRQMSNTLERR